MYNIIIFNFRNVSCKYSSKIENTCSFNQPPLTESLPNLPNVIYSKHKLDNIKTNITKLPSGIRIASEVSYGEFCTVGGNISTYFLIINLNILHFYKH